MVATRGYTRLLLAVLVLAVHGTRLAAGAVPRRLLQQSDDLGGNLLDLFRSKASSQQGRNGQATNSGDGSAQQSTNLDLGQLWGALTTPTSAKSPSQPANPAPQPAPAVQPSPASVPQSSPSSAGPALQSLSDILNWFRPRSPSPARSPSPGQSPAPSSPPPGPLPVPSPAFTPKPSPSTPAQSSPTPQPSPQPAPQPAPSGTPASKQQGSDPVQLHNAYRAVHGAGAVTWDSNLAATAQSWVDKLSSECRFYHSSGSYGENLAYGFSSWADVIWAWYAENSQYNYNNPGYSSATGHFTQVVWASTTRIGCASSRPNCNQGVVYACEYDPPGNIASAQYFRDNVKPPQ